MILIVPTDANRGTGFTKKPHPVDPEVQRILNRIKEIKKEEEFCLFENFKGNWQKVKKVVIFNSNRVYPSTEYFKFPANVSFLMKRATNLPGKNSIVTMEEYDRV